MQLDRDELLQAMYEEYQGPLRRVTKNNGIPDGYVDDIVQETFVAYFNHYPLDWTDAQKKAMLMTILKNKCTDYFRRNKHYDCVSMDTELFDETELLTQYVMKDTLDKVLIDETLKEVRETIMNMKDDWREIAVLHLIEQRPLSEVCQILDLKSSVCRMRLSRIRKYLRERFKSKGYHP